MSKENFDIIKVNKQEAKRILDKYHYLTGVSKGFKSGYNYGIYDKKEKEVVGVIIFTGFPVPELCKGMLGLERNDQEGLFELSRLCLTPRVQKEEHNLASWFVSKAIKELKKDTTVRVILSYADSKYHKGTVYRACNFRYYGLSAPKKDFYIKLEDGTFVKQSRGKTKGVEGKWVERTRKHRFLLVFDKKLVVKWKEVNYETGHNL
jgi:hypothetical protein